MPWPPTSKDLDSASFTNTKLFNMFLNVLLCGSIKDKSERVERLKHSYSQDLTYAVTNGCIKTPKSVLFPYHMKSLTNCTELINLCCRLGHGVSYTLLEEVSTEIAYTHLEAAEADGVHIPEGCVRGKFTIEVDDNIDRLEETLSGKSIGSILAIRH